VFVLFALVTPMPIGAALLIVRMFPSYERAAIRGPIETPVFVFATIPAVVIVVFIIPIAVVPGVVAMIVAVSLSCQCGHRQQR
jgi:hypothetical protein